MEEQIKQHIKNQQQHLEHEKELDSWEDRVVDCKELKWFCFKENIKRRLKKMKTWTKRNWQNIFVVIFSISCFVTTVFLYSDKRDNTDWIAQNEPVIGYLELSNGIDIITVHSHALPDYRPIYRDNGSIECIYVKYEYEYKGFKYFKILELVDNDIATIEEWLESIQMNYRSNDE